MKFGIRTNSINIIAKNTNKGYGHCACLLSYVACIYVAYVYVAHLYVAYICVAYIYMAYV